MQFNDLNFWTLGFEFLEDYDEEEEQIERENAALRQMYVEAKVEDAIEIPEQDRGNEPENELD